MFRRAVYLRPTIDEPTVAGNRGGVDHLYAAIALLRHLGEPDADPLAGAMQRSFAREPATMSLEDAAHVIPILEALPSKLQAARLIDEDDLLDAASVVALRAGALGRMLDLAPARGEDARYAANEELGNILGVAELLERAIAENLVIVLG